MMQYKFIQLKKYNYKCIQNIIYIVYIFRIKCD